MPTSFWALLLASGTLLGVLLAGALLLKKSKQPVATRYLALLALLVAIVNSGYVVMLSDLRAVFPAYPRLVGPFWFLLGPAFYGYVRLLTHRPFRTSRLNLLHLLPFVLECLPVLHAVLFPESFFEAGYRRLLYLPRTGPIPWETLLISNRLMVHLFVYACLSARQVWRYERSYKQEASHPQVTYATWLRLAFAGFAGYVIYETTVSLILTVTRSLQPGYIYFSVFFLSMLLYGIVYLAIAHPQILFPPLTQPQEKPKPLNLPEVYREQHREKLLALMDAEKPYLQGDLKLRDLADLLDISTHHLTEVLNQEVGKNFYEFINAYRVKEAQARLRDPAYQHYSILSIALDVGFNSKSTFNRLFKQHTRMTPSEYLKSHRIRSKSPSEASHSYQ